MFSANDDGQSKSFEPIKPGTYRFEIKSAFLKPDKNNNGEHWEFVMENEEGKKVWHRPNWKNSNATAQTIGRQALGDLCFAVGAKNAKGEWGFDSVENLQMQTITRQLLAEVYIEIYNGKEGARVSAVWNVEGKHRNDKRHLDPIRLGPNGKGAVMAKGQAAAAPSPGDDGLPF